MYAMILCMYVCMCVYVCLRVYVRAHACAHMYKCVYCLDGNDNMLDFSMQAPSPSINPYYTDSTCRPVCTLSML